jgi:hypothetical protein
MRVFNNLRYKITDFGPFFCIIFFTYPKWLYTIIAIELQNKTLGNNNLLGAEYPKLIKQAKGVKTIAEAYKA